MGKAKGKIMGPEEAKRQREDRAILDRIVGYLERMEEPQPVPTPEAT